MLLLYKCICMCLYIWELRISKMNVSILKVLLIKEKLQEPILVHIVGPLSVDVNSF